MRHLLSEAFISSTLHREPSRENLAGKVIGKRRKAKLLGAMTSTGNRNAVHSQMGMPENTTPSRGSLRRWAGPIIIGGTLFAIGGGVFVGSILLDPWQWFLKHSRYEEIVRRIEADGIRAGQEQHYLISADKDPATLRRTGDLLALPNLYDTLVRGEVIEARRSSNGQLRVKIKMPGRRPTYELVYLSGEPDKSEVDGIIGMAYQWHQPAEHWWAIDDRSD